MHFTRALFGTMAMAALYYALAASPVAEVIALTFLIPIFTTIGAGLILKETIGHHRGAATLLGFLGALVIIRPGFTEISWPIFLVVLRQAFVLRFRHEDEPFRPCPMRTHRDNPHPKRLGRC